MNSLAKHARHFRRWLGNPVQAAYEIFKFEPDEWQKDGLNAAISAEYNPRRRLMMKACTGPGKTAELAVIGWLRLLLYGKKGGHPKGIALSGEGKDNLKDGLWAELANWQKRSDMLLSSFTWTKERIFFNDHPEDWFLSARAYAKDANTEAIGKALAGLHSPFPFVLLDETGNMPPQVGQKATQIFTGGVVDGLIAGAGNPVSTSGLLYHSATVEAALWFLITITADPDDPKRTPRVPIEHAREMIKTYGRENPWVMATILGLFPPGGINTLMGPDDVQAAMQRHYREEQYAWAQRRLGVDVARFGDDRSVIFQRQGLVSLTPTILRKQDTVAIAGKVAMIQAGYGSGEPGYQAERIYVDDSGHWGHGVLDNLKAGGYRPSAVLFEDEAQDPRYLNRRAEMWMRLSEWVKTGGLLPNMPELTRELTAPTYTFQNGKFKLEPKDLIKKRLGFSPDLGDALALTFADPEMPAQMRSGRVSHGKRGKLQSAYDPYAER